MNDNIRTFIGFDSRETQPYYVLSHSILRQSSKPVSITPLMLSQLSGLLTREAHPLQSTDFAFSRFLTPYLCSFDGWALFMDCDMLFREDIARLWELRDDKYAVMCVKHEHEAAESTKFLNQSQTAYPKKNWSSFMLFNCKKCKALTPDYVNSASGLELHQFKWLESEGLIGELPIEWNHLVGVNQPNANASNVHYTLGGPYFEDYKSCEYSDEWFKELKLMNRVDQI